MAPANKSEELKGHNLLVRTIEANLAIKVPDAVSKRFRSTALRKVIAEIQDMPAGLVIRIYEAACDVDFPDQEISNLCHVCEPVLAKHMGFEAFKSTRPKPAPAPAR